MKIVEIAEKEAGYLEKATNKQLDHKTANAGRNNWTKYGAWYGLNGYAWCAMFVSWCAHQAGVPEDIIPKFHSCTMVMNWFKRNRRWKPRKGYTPVKGDIILYGSGDTAVHVGIVTGSDKSRVYTVEGNTSGGSTLIANGGSVAKKSYALTYGKILGYGHPDYQEDDMTGEEIYTKLNEYLMDTPAPDWAQEELQEAIDAGITDGTRPMQLIPRYQAAIMAHRASKK